MYSKTMGEVDLKDTKLYACFPERRPLKWTTKLTFYFLGTAMLNAYIIYKMHISQIAMPRLRFMLSIIEVLIS